MYLSMLQATTSSLFLYSINFKIHMGKFINNQCLTKLHMISSTPALLQPASFSGDLNSEEKFVS